MSLAIIILAATVICMEICTMFVKSKNTLSPVETSKGHKNCEETCEENMEDVGDLAMDPVLLQEKWVDEYEFNEFVKKYPRPLKSSFFMDTKTFHDSLYQFPFNSIVASKYIDYGNVAHYSIYPNKRDVKTKSIVHLKEGSTFVCGDLKVSPFDCDDWKLIESNEEYIKIAKQSVCILMKKKIFEEEFIVEDKG